MAATDVAPRQPSSGWEGGAGRQELRHKVPLELISVAPLVLPAGCVFGQPWHTVPSLVVAAVRWDTMILLAGRGVGQAASAPAREAPQGTFLQRVYKRTTSPIFSFFLSLSFTHKYLQITRKCIKSGPCCWTLPTTPCSYVLELRKYHSIDGIYLRYVHRLSSKCFFYVYFVTCCCAPNILFTGEDETLRLVLVGSSVQFERMES